MPELPEVEIISRQLNQEIVGLTIHKAAVFWDRVIAHPDAGSFQAEIPDLQITNIWRRAKFLIFSLTGSQSLVFHRRMSGNLLLRNEGASVEKYCLVEFNLSDGRMLYLSDPRKFSRVGLWQDKELSTLFHALGPEPLSEEFTVEVLTRKLSDRNRIIKPLLLDQAVIAGLGNIYTDEALFRAGIHPQRLSSSLAHEEINALYEAIRYVLTESIGNGGTTFGRHRNIWGEIGGHLSYAAVYHKQGEPCIRCGELIKRIEVGGRGTHICPRCQVIERCAAKA